MDNIWIYASVGSFFPIIFWIFFWKRQDLNQPEPIRLIIKTFLFGILSVFFALMLQQIFNSFLEDGILKITLFSFIEELVKFLVVFIAALGTVWNNEKRDPMFYMIIGALGFTTIENFYYILNFLQNSELLSSLIESSYRFLGASLLHVITSATVGLFISFAFFKRKQIRILMAILGLVLATAIHTLFNFLALSGSETYEKIALYGSWFLIVLLLVIFQIFDKKEKYRIRRDGVIYYHEKHISFEEKILFKTGKIKNHEDIFRVSKIDKKKLSDSEYETYDDDEFRKKFY